MSNYDKLIRRWIDIALGYNQTGRQIRNDRMPVNGDRIFSYGSHFEMARLIRNKKGESSHWLVNGDTWGPTTSKHQHKVRSALERTGLPMVIIPHRALAAAGIDLNSVHIIEVTPDRWTATEHVEYSVPDGCTVTWEPFSDHVELTSTQWAWQELGHRRVCRDRYGHGWDMQYLPDGRTKYSRTSRRHWLGESLISAEVTYTDTRKCRECRGAPMQGPREQREVRGYGRSETLTWRDRVIQHTCETCSGRGITSRVKRRRTMFLSGFDSNETRPSYFFCEMPPKCTATTVAEAYNALKPDVVKQAEFMGRDVHRQGDIFAVPLTSLTKTDLRKAGANFVRMGDLLSTNHAATDAAYLPDGTTVVRGVLHHVPAGRRPDHKRVKLGDGKTWHVVVKNTVPLAA